MNKNRLLVIGLGNPLMGDDGVGIHVINELKRHKLSGPVEIIDGGAGGMDLFDILSTCRRVIVIDAIMDKRGGSSDIKLYSPDDLILRGEGSDYSIHDMELTSVLSLMKTLDMDMPEIKIIGVPAVDIAPRIGLSEECSRFIPEAIDLTMKMVKGGWI